LQVGGDIGQGGPTGPPRLRARDLTEVAESSLSRDNLLQTAGYEFAAGSASARAVRAWWNFALRYRRPWPESRCIGRGATARQRRRNPRPTRNPLQNVEPAPGV